MATCAAIGQGVGTAAAHAINAGLEPTEIPGNPHAIRAIQQRLLCDDCYLIGRLDEYLIGRLDEDEGDRAPSARITTSSETDDGAAATWLRVRRAASTGSEAHLPTGHTQAHTAG